MSPAEVKAAEQSAVELISKNGEVYAKDSPLSLAKAIQGLRAVFNEVGIFSLGPVLKAFLAELPLLLHDVMECSDLPRLAIERMQGSRLRNILYALARSFYMSPIEVFKGRNVGH